jgi:hypothetical protein
VLAKPLVVATGALGAGVRADMIWLLVSCLSPPDLLAPASRQDVAEPAVAWAAGAEAWCEAPRSFECVLRASALAVSRSCAAWGLLGATSGAHRWY